MAYDVPTPAGGSGHGELCCYKGLQRGGILEHGLVSLVDQTLSQAYCQIDIDQYDKRVSSGAVWTVCDVHIRAEESRYGEWCCYEGL